MDKMKVTKAEQQPQQLLFIAQDSSEFRRDNLRAIVSHARKTQTQQKYRRQRSSAQRDATYARSLVGWRQGADASTKNTGCAEVAMNESALNRAKNDVIVPVRDHIGGESINLEIDLGLTGGLRIDPFNSLPFETDRAAWELLDFYVHVYSFHKTAVIDDVVGPDTMRDVCWPYVLRDELTCNATLALTRIVWLLSHELPCQDDPQALHYIGTTLSKLKESVKHSSATTEAIIFAVARLVTIAYLTCDNAALQVHLDAFRQLTDQYMSTKTVNDSDGRRIHGLLQGYVRGWESLQTYRVCSKSSSPAQTSMGALDWQIRPLQHDNPQTREGIPYGFDLLLSHGSISPNLFAIIAELNTLLREPASPDTTNTNTNTILVYCSTHLKHIIDSDTVSSIELQLCCGLHAFCALVRHQLTSTHDADLAQYFDKLTSRFIHHKLAGASASTLHRSTLQWASLMLGSACFLPLPDIPSSTHTKGHIILFTLHERLLPTTSFNEEATINNLCQELSETFWLPSSLASPLKQIYQAAMTRQRDWEGRGLFKMGVPNGDRVEYMVLRSFRGALPTIPMVDLWE